MTKNSDIPARAFLCKLFPTSANVVFLAKLNVHVLRILYIYVYLVYKFSFHLKQIISSKFHFTYEMASIADLQRTWGISRTLAHLIHNLGQL